MVLHIPIHTAQLYASCVFDAPDKVKVEVVFFGAHFHPQRRHPTRHHRPRVCAEGVEGRTEGVLGVRGVGEGLGFGANEPDRLLRHHGPPPYRVCVYGDKKYGVPDTNHVSL